MDETLVYVVGGVVLFLGIIVWAFSGRSKKSVEDEPVVLAPEVEAPPAALVEKVKVTPVVEVAPVKKTRKPRKPTLEVVSSTDKVKKAKKRKASKQV
jgi:hypothetical protein